jgi:hypothetical protein
MGAPRKAGGSARRLQSDITPIARLSTAHRGPRRRPEFPRTPSNAAGSQKLSLASRLGAWPSKLPPARCSTRDSALAQGRCPVFISDAVKRTSERPLFGATRLGGAEEYRTPPRARARVSGRSAEWRATQLLPQPRTLGGISGRAEARVVGLTRRRGRTCEQRSSSYAARRQTYPSAPFARPLTRPDGDGRGVGGLQSMA